jgi:hypothetical protein
MRAPLLPQPPRRHLRRRELEVFEKRLKEVDFQLARVQVVTFG